MPARHTTSGIRSGGIAAQRRDSSTTVETPSAGSRSAPAAIAVRVAVGVQAQPRARPDLEQGDRALDAAQRGQQRRAPQRLVGLQAARGALGDDLVGVRGEPGRPVADTARSGAPSIRVTANTSGGWRCVAGMRARIAATPASVATPAAQSA